MDHEFNPYSVRSCEGGGEERFWNSGSKVAARDNKQGDCLLSLRVASDRNEDVVSITIATVAGT